MKTGFFGQQLTLMEELKAGTFLPHARLQTAPFFQALAACQLPLESYVGQLRALAAIHGVLEPALETSPDAGVSSVWTGDMRQLPRLQADLWYFEPRAVADVRESVDATLNAVERIRLRSLEHPLTLLGCLYVVEGATLGATVLRPLYARAFLLTGTEGLAFLQGYGLEVRARWARYQQRMNALSLSPDERAQITQAAVELFALLESVFRTLHPFPPESKTFLVASINPEAGRHPVPADARELQASVRAGDRCWERFPYFEHRYGERGLRFARSDAAWLASLCQYEPPQIVQQVRWLGRVLTCRGMPTFLLQVQMEILFEELVAAIPEKKPAYEKLLLSVAALHASRRRHLDDDQFQALASSFDHTAGPEWSEKLPHTGALLAAAVVDELEGCEGAEENLRRWMIDPARFPATWVAAVQATLAQARSLARRPEEADANHP